MARAIVAIALIGVAAVILLIVLLWRKPPQMGSDDEVAKAVDALFTAVTARDEKLLGDCERRLNEFEKVGKLPTEASAYLDNIIRKAHSGRWESAAEALYDFMRAQHRDRSHE